MFKRIIFLFIALFLLYIGFYVQAKDQDVIYIEKGSNYYNLLEVDDAIIISNNININEVGKYEVTYFSKSRQTYFKKEVIVYEGSNINYFELKDSISIDNNLEIEKAYYNDNLLIIGAKRKVVGGNNNFDFYKATVLVYQDNNLVKRIDIDYYSEVKDIIFSEAGFICLINFDFSNRVHLMINEYSIEGSLLRNKIIMSDKTDIGKNIYLDNNYLYLIYNSSSQISPYKSLYNDVLSLMIIKINYLSFKDDKFIVLGNDSSNDIYESIYDNGYFYILFKPIGSGDFLKKLKGSKSLIKVDSNLRLISYLELDNGYGYYGISLINDKLYYLSSEYSRSSKITFTIIDLDLIKIDAVDYFFLTGDAYVKEVKTIKEKSLYLMVNGVSNVNNNDTFLGIIRIKDGIINYEKEVIDDAKCIGIYNQTGIIFKNKDKIEINNYYKVDINDPYIVNELEVSHEVLYDTYLENKLYGSNLRIDGIIVGDAIILKSVNYYQELLCSVNSNETYEKGIIITGNGHMFLNDLEINEGYIVKNEGDYLLKIYGVNNEISYLEFKVRDIICKPNLDLIEDEATIYIDDIIINIASNDIINIDQIDYLNLTEKSENSILIIVLIIGISVVSIIIIAIIKKRGRK